MSHRAVRIGVLLPPPNVTVEAEFQRYAPKDVSFHWNRVARSTRAVTVDSLTEMANNAVPSARTLSMASIDALAFACTSASFVHGGAWDEQLNARLAEVTNLPTATTSRAVTCALSTVEASRIALATPYTDQVTRREVGYLAEHAHTVVSSRCLDLEDSRDIAMVSSQTVKALAEDAHTSACDAVFLSCTNLATLDVIDELEAALRTTVVSSNQMTLWWCLRTAGRTEPLSRGGRLLKDRQYWKPQGGSGQREIGNERDC